MQMNSSPIKKLSYQIKLFSKNLCADGSATLCSKSEVMLTVLNCIYLLLWWVNLERSCGSKKHVLFLLPQLNWKGRSDLTLKAQKTNKTFWAISSDIYWKRTFSNERLIMYCISLKYFFYNYCFFKAKQWQEIINKIQLLWSVQ